MDKGMQAGSRNGRIVSRIIGTPGSPVKDHPGFRARPMPVPWRLPRWRAATRPQVRYTPGAAVHCHVSAPFLSVTATQPTVRTEFGAEAPEFRCNLTEIAPYLQTRRSFDGTTTDIIASTMVNIGPYPQFPSLVSSVTYTAEKPGSLLTASEPAKARQVGERISHTDQLEIFAAVIFRPEL